MLCREKIVTLHPVLRTQTRRRGRRARLRRLRRSGGSSEGSACAAPEVDFSDSYICVQICMWMLPA